MVAKHSHIPSTALKGEPMACCLWSIGPPALGVAFSVLFSVLCLVHAAFKAPALLARPCDPGHQLYFVYHYRDSLSTLNSAAFWFYLGLGPS